MENLKVLENGLIPVMENEKGEKLVNAREFHTWLENKDKFTTWMNDRIKQYDFEENVDFTSFSENSEKPNGGRPSKEYIITLDMAKELAMVERNEKGREARKYFLAVEKKYKEVTFNFSKSPLNMFKLGLKVLEEHDQKLKDIKQDIIDIKENSPLYNIECKELQDLVRKVGTKSLGGYKTPAYNNNSLRGKVYSDIQHQLKREFGVNKYEAIKRCQIVKAKEIVQEYNPPTILVDQIRMLNNQVQLDGRLA